MKCDKLTAETAVLICSFNFDLYLFTLYIKPPFEKFPDDPRLARVASVSCSFLTVIFVKAEMPR